MTKQASPAEESPDVVADRLRRMKWWTDARFGMFVHFGLYSQLGRHEWVMNRERIPVKEYEKLARTFNPAPGSPREWAALAKKAGMKYMVMTTKHHEGFCLWDSKLTDYNAVKRGPGRDLVAEYVDACREFGLKCGFYYSLMDWHHPDGLAGSSDEPARRRFIDYTHGLVRELMSNYGKVDILWYDVPAPLKNADEETVANWPMPSPDDYDYSHVLADCEERAPYAIHLGDAGLACIINTAGFLRGMEYPHLYA